MRLRNSNFRVASNRSQNSTSGCRFDNSAGVTLFRETLQWSGMIKTRRPSRRDKARLSAHFFFSVRVVFIKKRERRVLTSSRRVPESFSPCTYFGERLAAILSHRLAPRESRNVEVYYMPSEFVLDQWDAARFVNLRVTRTPRSDWKLTP